MPMTFDELRAKLRGGPLIKGGHPWPHCEIPDLPVELLSAIPGLEVQDTDFPGCFRFTVPVAEGDALYVGTVETTRNSRKHGRGSLRLLPWLGNGA